MNNAIQLLKEQAVEKRDQVIDAAKKEYNETLQKINELDSRLTGDKTIIRPSKPTLTRRIFENLPNDRAFSQSDVAGILDAFSERKYAKSSINMTISRMLKAGDIKRVRYSKAGKPALYALPDVEVEEEKTMIQWAQEVEGWRTMEPVEIMVEMVENGYELPAACLLYTSPSPRD